MSWLLCERPRVSAVHARCGPAGATGVEEGPYDVVWQANRMLSHVVGEPLRPYVLAISQVEKAVWLTAYSTERTALTGSVSCRRLQDLKDACTFERIPVLVDHGRGVGKLRLLWPYPVPDRP